MTNTRYLFFIVFSFICLILGTAFFLQHTLHLEPCPSCVLQRLVLMGIALILFIGALHNPQVWGRRFYSLVVMALSLYGMYLASHQVWLQQLPPIDLPPCGPSLSILWQHFPLKTFLSALFEASGQCGVVDWRWLGLSFAGWSLICFHLIELFAFSQFLRSR